MRPTLALLLVLAAPVAHSQELAKLFTDGGKTYVRTDDPTGLLPGAELEAFADAAGKKSAGRVVVMEVAGQLVRVAFDDDAPKGAAKYVRLSRAGPAPAAPAPSAGPPPPPPPPSPPGVPPPPPPLRATLGRAGNTITIRNDSEGGLSGCELKFPDRRWAPAGSVPPRRTISVGYGEIRPAPDLGDDWILVRCAEGEAELHFNQPGKANALHGRAEGRGSGVLIFNDGNTDWTKCDLIKPNGNHFMQGDLRARSSDSVRGGLFRPREGAEIITLTCMQGAMSQPVP